MLHRLLILILHAVSLQDLYDELGGLRSKLSFQVLPRTLEDLHYIILNRLAGEQ